VCGQRYQFFRQGVRGLVGGNLSYFVYMKVIKFPTKPNPPKEDVIAAKLSDEIDAVLLKGFEKLSVGMVGAILANRLGEVIKYAQGDHDPEELKKYYFEVINKRTEGL